MPPLKSDIAGRRVGRLTVREFVPGKRGRQGRWLCDCDCGGTALAFGHRLAAGSPTSCGCARRLNLAGRRFGRLVAREPVCRPTATSRRYDWRCDCDCGGTAVVSTGNLLSKRSPTLSCGCLRRERAPVVMSAGIVPSFRRSCAVCGVEFVGVARQIYCTPACGHRSRYPRRDAYCPVCGTKFVHGVSGKVYCDERCRRVAGNQRRLASKRGSPYDQAATLSLILETRRGRDD